MVSAPPGRPSPCEVTVIVYALSKLPVTTAWAVMVLPAAVHVESIVTVLPDFCTSRLEHCALGMLPALACNIWSVDASMHWRNAAPVPLLPLISHSPGLRDGISAAAAGSATSVTSRVTIACRVMHPPVCGPKRSLLSLPCTRHQEKPDGIARRRHGIGHRRGVRHRSGDRAGARPRRRSPGVERYC